MALGIDEHGNIVGWARQAAGGQCLRAFLWKPHALETVVTIDIRPHNPINTINLKADGKILIAILSTLEFDAYAAIDRTSVTFGRTGDEVSLTMCLPEGLDVNGDGAADLVYQFNTALTGLTSRDVSGTLRARTVEGQAIVGTDVVRILAIEPR